MPSLDPAHLTQAASINLVRIVDLPGVALDPDVRGRAGRDLLLARVLAADVERHVAVLGIETGDRGSVSRLLAAFDRCFTSADPVVVAAADAIARCFGRRLGFLILTLVRGDEINRAARPEWDNTYWDQWTLVRGVLIGGGLVAGQLGPRLVNQAAAVVADAGQTDVSVRLADHPAILPLIGMARSLPIVEGTAAVLDFGHSAAKRAHARYEAGRLVSLSLLPTAPVPRLGDDRGREDLEVLVAWILAVIVETWQAIEPRDAATFTLGASMACYLRDGHPLTYQRGIYSDLGAVSDHLARQLSEGVSTAVGHPVTLTLLHDGTAAARAVPGVADAVLMLGTAIGVGYAPGVGDVLPVTEPLPVIGGAVIPTSRAE